MSIIQDRKELRYIKRQNLEEESRVIGNYYRDLIRSYGVDVRYFKISIPYPETFTTIVDQNSLLLNAYGYDDHPDWSISCDMISYMEVDNDIFSLNRYGAMPTTDVTFYFDSIDFACSLAPQLGRVREYPIREQRFVIDAETPDEIENLKLDRDFQAELLRGTVRFDFSALGDVSLGKPFTVWGEVVRKSAPLILFKANTDIYKSFNYRLSDEDCEDIRIHLEATIVKTAKGLRMQCVMGGGVLFRDLEAMGKYATEIVPSAGDIVTIDFPDEESREKFEITSCTDRQLSPDGLNPLLHRYIWRCKAKRLVQAEEGFPERNAAEDRLKEKLETGMVAMENITEQISLYPEAQDKVYGGYTGSQAQHPTNAAEMKPANTKDDSIPEDWKEMTIFSFPDGADLTSDGFSLFFKSSSGKVQKVETVPVLSPPEAGLAKTTSQKLQMLKAVDKKIYFTAIDGTCSLLSGEKVEKPDSPPITLEALTSPTLFSASASTPDPNRPNDSSLKFPGTTMRLETYQKGPNDQGLRSVRGKTPIEVFI